MFIPQTTRLSHLRLDGFRWGSAVFFCPFCDFQYDRECVAIRICPKCDAALSVATVTPDLVERARAAA